MYASILKVVFLGLVVFCANPSEARQVQLGGDERPASLKFPPHYKDSNSYPLVLLLHGRGTDADLIDLYLGLSRSQWQLGYFLLLPNGTVRADGQRVWNATEECCATNNKDVDDSKYLQDLVREAMAHYSIDPKRVYVFGYSNGGFMAYRLACDTEGLFAGLVSIAGSEFASAMDCQTQTPVNVLHVHGTEDEIVPFDAKSAGKAYPGAYEIVERWAERNQCQTLVKKPRSQNLVLIKLEPGLGENGNVTIVGSWTDYLGLRLRRETDEYLYQDCLDNVRVGLWQINDSNHAPVFIGTNFVKKALQFLGDR